VIVIVDKALESGSGDIMNNQIISPREAAELLDCDYWTLIETCKQRPEVVHFNFTFVGNRLKIPKEAFLKWLRGEIPNTNV